MQHIPVAVVFPDPFAFNEFYGFNIAIDAETTGNQYAIKIDEAKFDNNQLAIAINGNNYVEIIRCDINQTAYKSPISYKRKGIILNCCTGYHIEENRFYDNYQSYAINSYGIKVSESGRNSNMIYRNAFNQLENGILVSGINGNSRGGLQFLCNSFSNNNYDIYLMDSVVVSPIQGTLLAGADNEFTRPFSYNIYNEGSASLSYLYSASTSIHYPSLTYQVFVSSRNVSSNSCSSSIFNLNPFTLNFDKNRLATMVSSYQNMDSERMTQWEMTNDNTYNASSATSEMMSLQQKISDLYYETVLQIMLDSLTDMTLLADWHAAASSFSDPYSLSETINQINEPVELAGIAIEDSAERENYTAFRALKTECSALTTEIGVNWYTISEEQIAKLIQIAELNTGRTSVMAKGILCFFFDICFEDDDEASQLRNARCLETNTKREMQVPELLLYPNPANNTFSIRFSNAQEKVRQVQVINLTGKVMLSMEAPRENMVNISNLPIGTYIVRIFGQSGKEYATKMVKE